MTRRWRDRHKEQGWLDAQAGRTACPYGVPDHAAKWARGYDSAVDEGLSLRPRFGQTRRRRYTAVAQESLGL